MVLRPGNQAETALRVSRQGKLVVWRDYPSWDGSGPERNICADPPMVATDSETPRPLLPPPAERLSLPISSRSSSTPN